jgi:leucyl-tRNA synthetase
MPPRYEPRRVEAKWQRIWEERRLFNATEDPNRPKYYVLEMFPYPSGTCATIPSATWWPATSACGA